MLCCLAQVFGLFSLSTIHDRFAALFVVANGFAFVLAALLYLSGRRARGAVPGMGRGFFLGLDHTPNWLGVDLKLFSYRPSLVALALINASFAVVQYEKYGELTLAMAVYQLLTFLYLFNYFQFEYGMTYTWDMISERFGWLLIWGDYVLVPFFYCLPGWWLIHSPDSLSTAGATAIILLFLFGGWIFRGANEQKHRFKLDSKAMIWGKPAESLEGSSAGFGLLGYRTTSQLYRRDPHLLRLYVYYRVRVLGAVSASRVARRSVVASIETRRPPLPREVRSALGTVHPAGTLHPDPVYLLRGSGLCCVAISVSRARGFQSFPMGGRLSATSRSSRRIRSPC